jgi:acyl-CoA reductase-like NAD-dependent aldehyde dehydrogenase
MAPLAAPETTEFVSRNPATEEAIRHYAVHDADAIDGRLGAAFGAWRWTRQLALDDRSEILSRLASYFDANTEPLSRLITQEMGKPLTEARQEIAKCAATCRIVAGSGPSHLSPALVPTEASSSYIRYDSIGPLLAIMPWNFPFFQVVRLLAPAIIAGNTVVLKHAENVPACAEALETAVTEACSREGALVNLRVHRETIGSIITDSRIRGVTLTGSVAAGRAVAALSGAAGKKIALELGGSDPFIVLDDADLDTVTAAAVQARFANAGQSCICGKRFLVARPVADSFRQAFAEAAGQLVTGDPMDPATNLGPLARADLVARLQQQVEATLAMGATSVLAGGPVPGPGYFYRPVILAGIPPAAPAASEELFGPVASIFVFQDDDQAVCMANETSFGLGCSVWTGDRSRAERFIELAESGMVFVNGIVRSDARLPFGGVKDSGFGRELGIAGATEFTNAKTVWIA